MNAKFLEKQLIQAESKLQFLQGQKSSLEEQLKDNLVRIKDLEVLEETFSRTSVLLQLVSEKTREHSIEKIERIASQALQEVFANKNIHFKIVFENKRNIVTADFKLWDEELQQEVEIIKAEAGGYKNLISTILRLLVIDLYQPKILGPVILDEIGANVSAEHQERFGKFLQQYSKLTGRQIILVSHCDKYVKHADRKIRLQRAGTESKVAEVCDAEERRS